MDNPAANKETAKKFLIAMGTGDVETVKSLITDDMAIVTTGTSLISVTHDYHALLGIAKGISKISKGGIDFDFLNLTAEENRVAVETHGKSTLLDGTAYNNQYHFLIFFRDDKICRMHEYLDTKLVDAVLVPRLSQ